MRTVSKMLVASMLCTLVSPALATPDEEVRDIVTAWAQAYTDGDYNKISQFYDRYAPLRGVDTADLIGPEAISEHYYFEKGHNALQSVKLGEIKCYSYDDATAACTGDLQMNASKRTGESLSQPSQFNMAFAYDEGSRHWVIQDHRVQRGITTSELALAQCKSTQVVQVGRMSGNTEQDTFGLLCGPSVVGRRYVTSSPFNEIHQMGAASGESEKDTLGYLHTAAAQ